MFKKTLISEFFTTINLNIFLRTLAFLTYKLPFIRYGKSVGEFEREMLSYIGKIDSRVLSFYNGRSAIFHSLKIIGVKENDEVIVSGYTCVSVSNAVIQSGAKIVYVDINKNNLGLNIDDLKNKITKNTKVIIVQHTFGKPSDILEIVSLAKLNNILLIEDCAHSLGSRVNSIKTGTFGDFSIFSTGRDKVISGVTGGILIINNKKFFGKLEEIHKKLKMPSIGLTFKNLFYNISAYKAYKLYDFFSMGKLVIFLSRKFGLITEILTLSEKKCNFKEFNYLLPNSLAYLASEELKKIKLVSTHRNSIAEYYDEMIKNEYIKVLFKKGKNEKNNYFRYPILLKSEKIKDEFYQYMKNNNVLVGNTWSGINIVPKGTILKDAKYILGNCPISEDISKRILILANHASITFEDAKKIVQLINNFKKNV